MNFEDQKSTLDEMKKYVADFCEARDWDQFHGAKDLAIGVVTEGSELLEHFRFMSAEQVDGIMSDDLKRREVSEELSDIFFFLLRFSQKFDLDLAQSFSQKMKKNEVRYSVEKFKGKNHKA